MILSLGGIKGGSGKTTLEINIAYISNLRFWEMITPQKSRTLKI